MPNQFFMFTDQNQEKKIMCQNKCYKVKKVCYNKFMKTIVAISTPVGAGAISIVRISGKDCLKIANKVFCAKEKLSPRKLILGKFHADGINEKCLAVYFKAPNSYTGEDIIEFHFQKY